jgi:hypothetical protein
MEPQLEMLLERVAALEKTIENMKMEEVDRDIKMYKKIVKLQTIVLDHIKKENHTSIIEEAFLEKEDSNGK